MATLLLIDESPTDRAQLRGIVQNAGLFESILESEDGLSGIKLLLSEPVDLVLSNLDLPGASGDKVLVIRNSLGQNPPVPFLMLADGNDYRRNARLMREGASDVIAKPIHPADLVARLDAQLKIARIQRKLLKKLELLEHLSSTDPLTGLRNRAHLSDVLAVEFERAQRYGMPLSVVLADVDRFKQVNDTAGHAAGDAVLRTVGEMLVKNLRKSDVGGRYGGDEFLVVLAHSELDGAAVFAERWRRDVQDAIVESGKNLPAVTLSLGVASYRAGFAKPEDLIEAADVALLQAKRSQRNTVVVAPTAVPEEDPA